MSKESLPSNLICHAWKLQGHQIVSFKVVEGSSYEYAVAPLEDYRFRCPACRSVDVVRAGVVRRRLRCLPIGNQRVVLDCQVQRVRCHGCGLVRQSGPMLAAPRRSCTFAFENYVLALSRLMTTCDVARHAQLSWDTVKDIVARHLRKHYEKPPLKRLEYLGIDEIHVGRSGKFLTLVVDWTSGQVVYVGDGRGGDSLLPFWKRLRASGARIKAVCTDMSPAYTAAVAEHLPRAAHVYDRFHVVKLMNEKLTELRRQVHRLSESVEGKKLLKGTRWLLVKNPENLDEKRDQKKRLEEALRVNKPLATAYYLKEDLRLFWTHTSKTKAEHFLNGWIARTQSCKIPILMRFARFLTAHKKQLLNWYDYAISNGPIEGTNNKIQLMKRQAYGYRDIEFFKLKIKALHESRYALIG